MQLSGPLAVGGGQPLGAEPQGAGWQPGGGVWGTGRPINTRLLLGLFLNRDSPSWSPPSPWSRDQTLESELFNTFSINPDGKFLRQKLNNKKNKQSNYWGADPGPFHWESYDICSSWHVPVWDCVYICVWEYMCACVYMCVWTVPFRGKQAGHRWRQSSAGRTVGRPGAHNKVEAEILLMANTSPWFPHPETLLGAGLHLRAPRTECVFWPQWPPLEKWVGSRCSPHPGHFLTGWLGASHFTSLRLGCLIFNWG